MCDLFPHLLSYFAEIRYKKCVGNAVQQIYLHVPQTVCQPARKESLGHACLCRRGVKNLQYF